MYPSVSDAVTAALKMTSTVELEFFRNDADDGYKPIAAAGYDKDWKRTFQILQSTPQAWVIDYGD